MSVQRDRFHTFDDSLDVRVSLYATGAQSE